MKCYKDAWLLHLVTQMGYYWFYKKTHSLCLNCISTIPEYNFTSSTLEPPTTTTLTYKKGTPFIAIS